MLRDDLSEIELKHVTELVHYIKPHLKDYKCVGIEVPQKEDRNVVFHMSNETDSQTVMITTDYFIKQLPS